MTFFVLHGNGRFGSTACPWWCGETITRSWLLSGIVQKTVIALLFLGMSVGCASPRLSHKGTEDAITGAGAVHEPGTSVSSGSVAVKDDAAASPHKGVAPQGSPAESPGRVVVPSGLFEPSVVEDPAVQQYLALYTEKSREAFVSSLQRAQGYLPTLRERFQAAGLPEELAYLPLVESAFDPTATSAAGAAGIWQIMPETARRFGLRVDWWVDERRDVFRATDAAISYLKYLYGQFGDWKLALAAYNAGEGAIDRALKSSGAESWGTLLAACLSEQTRSYVPKFAAAVHAVWHWEKSGGIAARRQRSLPLVPVAVRGATDLRELAQAVGIPWKEFHAFNAQYLRQATPPLGTSTVRVPAQYAAQVRQYLDRQSGLRPVAGLVPYTVRAGDSWSTLAKRTKVSAKELAAINAGVRLVPGRVVYLPARVQARAGTASSKAPKAVGGQANYAVRPGDTLSGIARKFGVKVSTLAAVNDLAPNAILRPGQGLFIPPADAAQVAATDTPRYYVVQPGDTVWGIARRFGAAPEDVLRWNRLRPDAPLRPGDTVLVQAP
jgi:membrane-bound lytic murein transglycosylase D